MKVTLRFDKSIQENASIYFEKSKKAKKKLVGLEKAIGQMSEKISSAEQKITTGKKIKIEKKREKKWFEKFHWFESSDDFLVLAGRDAKSNEMLIKKYFEKDDKFFHADIVGAAHVVAKSNGKQIPETTLKEAAQFAAVFCKAWQEKMSAVDVYSADQEQVTKQAPSGEAIKTGAFMVYGKREWYKKTPVEITIGADEHGRIISGPYNAVKEKVKFSFDIIPGDEGKNNLGKKMKIYFEKKTGTEISLDEINQMLPAGDMKIKLRN